MSYEKAVHFNGLNAVRFFSAFAIIVYHCTLSIQEGLSNAFKMFLHNLPLGVDMFFLISGFLIVYLLLTEKEESQTVSLFKFYTRRVLRIFPLYFLIIGIAWLQYQDSIPALAYERSLYFATNFYIISSNTWTVGILNPLWSICIEEHFYLVIPVLILFIPTRRLHIFFWLIIVLVIGFRLYNTWKILYHWMTIYIHTFSRCDVLAMGGLIAFYYKRYNFTVRFSNVTLGCLLLCLLLVMSFVDFTDYTTLLRSAFKRYLFYIPLILVFMGFIINKNETLGSGFLNKIKYSGWLDYLGKISFGLYLFHTPVIELLLPFQFINNYVLIKLILVSLVTIAISSISYEFFEKQFLRLKSKFEVIKSR